jgi:hypothetical protein
MLPLAGGVFSLNAFLAAGRWPLAAGRWLINHFRIFLSKRGMFGNCTIVRVPIRCRYTLQQVRIIMLLSIAEASRRWGVARTTIYRKMKNGSLSATNGKVDHVEMVRCFGEPSLTKEPEEMQLEVLRKRADMLQGQVDLLERFLAQEKEAFLRDKAVLTQEKEWLREQVEKAQETIKLLEHYKPTVAEQQPIRPERTKRGLLGRLIGAVLDE